VRAVGKRKFLHPLWRAAPLILRVQEVYGVGLDVALSMFVSLVKGCRMNLTAQGWPLDSVVCANSRTQLRDLVDFAWNLDLRVQPRAIPTAPARSEATEEPKTQNPSPTPPENRSGE
jgi:hypothetical protein